MRLVTRSDFDGLVCGMMLKEVGIINSVLFVHPKDLQDGVFQAEPTDVLCNVPFVPGCGMWFDHHTSELLRVGDTQGVPGINKPALSCARNVYEYFGGEAKYPQFKEIINAADQMDAGRLTLDEIRNPQGWVLLGFLADPRTGLGRFHNFRISNYNLMLELMDFLRTMTLDEILAHPDIAERIRLYHQQTELYIEMIELNSRVEGNVLITDLRESDPIYTSNRYTMYAVYPETNVSVWVADGRGKMNVMISVGHSIVNRTCQVDIGAMMLQYGGGGHMQVGTCQVSFDDADRVIEEIVEKLKA